MWEVRYSLEMLARQEWMSQAVGVLLVQGQSRRRTESCPTSPFIMIPADAPMHDATVWHVVPARERFRGFRCLMDGPT
jgi:hypothetical protein